jgi:hypothetical protein
MRWSWLRKGYGCRDAAKAILKPLPSGSLAVEQVD